MNIFTLFQKILFSSFLAQQSSVLFAATPISRIIEDNTPHQLVQKKESYLIKKNYLS